MIERTEGSRWETVRRDLLLGLAFWSVLDLFFFSRMYLELGVSGRASFTWREILGPHLLETVADIVLWTLYTPLILHLARRHPLGRRLRAWAVHVAAAVPMATLSSVVGWTVIRTTWPIPQPPRLLDWVVGTVHNNVQVYFLGVLAALAAGYYRRARDRELVASQLETQLARAHLHVLEMRLHPHFLFNTLNSISELVHIDPHAADRTLTRLGDLLRMSIDLEAGQEVPLERELELVSAYLEIERMRFRDRLTVEIRVDPEARRGLVPSLVLQPLVENAIRHGLSPRARPGRVSVAAERRGGRLRLVVTDDGRGLPRALRERVGLGTTRSRLEQLYGDAHRFELADAPGGGARATIEIPYRPAPEGAQGYAPARLAEAR